MAEESISTRFNPLDVQDKWYSIWEENGFFKAGVHNSSGKSDEAYSIVIPPPNVTGNLHMGHALDNTLQDILIRRRRMQGYNVLWLPGVDHAGISTQVVVEREIAKEGLTRHDLGREKFLQRVWEWKNQYGSNIINQLKRLGCSCDWSRERFTMDEGLSNAVRKVFVGLYNDGLIYRDNYIINWCPRCLTALSDLEVIHNESDGKLYHIKYPLVGEEGEYIVVATTRPETMLGDTAVAVHPDDERYKAVVGRSTLLPLMERTLPIVADSFVEAEFGSGAVKVTPAHDVNDFEIGKRHDLETINILNDDATTNSNAGRYEGLDRFKAREAVVEDLEKGGYLLKVEDYSHAVGHCQRCNTVVEPYLSLQWFVQIKPLAEPAIKAVENGNIELVPDNWKATYFNWMNNIRDWCISRQLWWGHRIPAWYCVDCKATIVSETDPIECDSCGGGKLEQDEDVLDTWFSSALWPFSTLGWPQETSDLKTYYPTSVLSTGHDIIFFWVARMIMMGLKFMEDVPFHKTYIHALVRDPQGKKMSKSTGNVVDPLDIISDYGVDAVRFGLAIMAIPGKDIPLSEERMIGSRNFANKIWNAARFVMMNLGDDFSVDVPLDGLKLEDVWILSRLSGLIGSVDEAIETFRFNDASQALYDFIWHEYCDWYLEMVKSRLYAKDGSAEEDRRTVKLVLWRVTENIMRLLHPFMPFLTEEIWQHLPHDGESIMVSSWPQADSAMSDPEAEKEIEAIMDIVTTIRNVRSEMHVDPGLKIDILIKPMDNTETKYLEDNVHHLKTLARVNEVALDKNASKPDSAATCVVRGLEIYLLLEGIVDLGEERTRLSGEIEKLQAALVSTEKKLGNQGFLSKAPAEVVAKEKDKRQSHLSSIEKLEESLERIK